MNGKKIKGFLKQHSLFIFFLLFLALPALLPNNYTVYVANRGLTNAIAVLGLAVLYGMTGQITLATMSYFAIGAYTAAVLQMTFHVNSVAAMLFGILMTTLWGIILSIPSFKLSGPFLTISTVAFGEIVKTALINMVPLTNGPSGLSDIPPVSVFGMKIATDKVWYYIILCILLLMGIAVIRLKRSNYGRAFYSVKDDELAASLMGVRVKKMKTIAFSTAAFLAGTAGVMYAHFAGFLAPGDFAQQFSANVFSMVVLGGGDAVLGGICSALGVTALPEILRFMQEYYIMVFNMVILVYLLTPWNKIGDWLREKTGRKSAAGSR
ncbi:branched-chain amino acid ABC transporter permease [Anaerolentibacter hominis]|uniref:branched-chain amino acid ABC transporter permease n=1 Tax=Anaerolentibacter hominis TaxID=3079009 RepID=UPI0031B81F25